MNKLPKSNYADLSTESSGKSVMENRSVSLTRNTNTMINHLSASNSNIIDSSISSHGKYLAKSIKSNKLGARRKSTQNNPNIYNKEDSYRDYGGVNNDYHGLSANKLSLNMSRDHKNKHKRAESSLLKLK